MRTFYAALAASALALGGYAQAQSPQSQDKTSSVQRPGAPTIEFVNKASIGDIYEIQSSRMALEKVEAKEFRTFAQRILDDHTKSSKELKTLAQNLQGVEVPSQLDPQHSEMIDNLKSASADDFARLYREQQIEAHNTAIRLFEQYARNGQQPKLKQFAERTLPDLRRHLDMAQALPQNPATVGRAPGTNERGAQAMHRRADQQRSAQAPAPPRQDLSTRQTRQVLSRLGPEHIRASDIMDASIYGANGEDIGEVDDVVVDRSGEVVAVIVGVGGFLGIGEKDVAIPFGALEISARADVRGRPASRTDQQAGTLDLSRLVLRHMTRRDLEAAPTFSNE